MRRRAGRATHLAASALVALVLLALALPVVVAQSEATYPAREPGQHVLDQADILPSDLEVTIQAQLATHLIEHGVDLVFVTRPKRPAGGNDGAVEDAQALLEAWAVGGEANTGAALVFNINPANESAKAGSAVGRGIRTIVRARQLNNEIVADVEPDLDNARWEEAAAAGVAKLQAETQLSAGTATPTPTQEPDITPRPPAPPRPIRPDLGGVVPAGPPYPDAVPDRSVYDRAEVLAEETEEILEDTIDAIEGRTGAEVVVYTQVKPEADTFAEAERDAVALIDQWGIGRVGFDDGLVILFDLAQDRLGGQVQLYAAPGYAAAYLTNEQRQAIFERDMLPHLRNGDAPPDFDAAVLAAIERIDETATAEHAQNLQLARQVDAAAGLILAPLLLIGLIGWAGWSWLRYGRDPEYLDDASILMPAPPPGMSPAAAAAIVDGRSKRKALTTALVDLAARGEISFRQSEDDRDEVDIDITVPDQRDARLARNRRQPLGSAEAFALRELKDLGGTRRTIAHKDLPTVSGLVGGFDERLEELVADKGWFREAPEDSIRRWSLRGGIVLILGIAGVFFGINLPSNGLLLVGGALVAAAVAMFVIARVMPQRTMEGARMYAQLAAYRRTLQKTLEQARTMDQVVSAGVLPWAETPDQVILWSYALGLHEEAEEVLERSLEDVRTGDASPTRTYFPLWFAIGPRTGARTSSAAKAPTAGLFSGGVVPDFTSMTAALSTIGNPPASSGGSGGGGFSGGSSGGGGGGAGGGF